MENTIKKPTLEQSYNEIIEVLKGVNRPDLIEFCEGRIELIHSKKASGKQTEKQAENEVLKEIVFNALTDEPRTVTEICKSSAEIQARELTNQKVTYLINALCNEGKATNKREKGRSLFLLAKVVD